jgi:hypothetical protein
MCSLLYTDVPRVGKYIYAFGCLIVRNLNELHQGWCNSIFRENNCA